MGRRRRHRNDEWAVVVDDDHEPSLQARFERTDVGRGLVAAVVVVIVTTVLVSNLPAQSDLYRTVQPRLNPMLEVTGLKQTWHLFAPTPRRRTKWLEAYVTYRDGTSVKWRQPESDPFIGTYRSSRWRKWASNVSLDGNRHLWPATAAYIGRSHRRDGVWPARVVLVRRIYQYPGLGSSGTARWDEQTLYVANFDEDGPRYES